MTVLVAYIPDAHGYAAVLEGMAESRRRGESVLLVNSSPGEAPLENRHANAIQIEKIAQEFEENGIALEIRQPMEGRGAAEDILQLADDADVSVVVLGVRSRSRTGKLLFGSTAQTVILNAPCPVLCVKAPSTGGGTDPAERFAN